MGLGDFFDRGVQIAKAKADNLGDAMGDAHPLPGAANERIMDADDLLRPRPSVSALCRLRKRPRSRPC